MPQTMPNSDLGFFMMLLMSAVVIVPFWFIFSKAGYSKWLSLLMVVPIVNLILLYFIAFSKWPNLTDNSTNHS